MKYRCTACQNQSNVLYGHDNDGLCQECWEKELKEFNNKKQWPKNKL